MADQESVITNHLIHDQIVLVRLGEITLKGQNRRKFEQQVIRNLRHRLNDTGPLLITQSQSRIWIEPKRTDEGPLSLPDDQLKIILERARDVFGVVSVSPVWRFNGDLDAIKAQAAAYVRQMLADGREKTFKIETRRGLKSFPLTSPEISEQVGGYLLEQFTDLLSVNVHQPDFILYLEIREQNYLYTTVLKAQRGLPVGTSGTGLLLLSGGIDSPVAGYLMASRGMQLEAVYFHAFPFTSDQARDKVIELCRILTRYAGRIVLHIVDFTDIQITLRDHCPPDMMTIVMRRMMMRIADRLAEERKIKALITGESLGQGASQTLEALITTDQIPARPVFRPLIGLDKDSTVAIARRIGTFDTSILPYEDCCTVFVARHPKTHPAIREAQAAEKELDLEALVQQGLSAITTLVIDPLASGAPASVKSGRTAEVEP
jgi:thiamine biosynthesis protein ThiI